MTLPLLLYILGPVLLGTLAVLTWSWRGRPIDDHPLCRKCGFDLTGKPETSTQCPECGADITHPKAIRIGHRRRRRRWLFASATALLLMLGGGIGAGYMLVNLADLVHRLPVSVLALIAVDAPATARHLACDEVANRAMWGKMTGAGETDGLIDRLLQRQANHSKSWDPAWGDMLSQLHAAKVMDALRWRTYQLHRITLSASARPRVRSGDRVPIVLTVTARGGSAGKGKWFGTYEAWPLVAMDLDCPDAKLTVMPRDSLDVGRSGVGSETFSLWLPGAGFEAANPGSHQMILVEPGKHRFELKLWRQETLAVITIPFTPEPAVGYTTDFVVDFLPPAEQSSRPLPPDAKRDQAIEGSFGAPRVVRLAGDRVSLSIPLANLLPVDLAYEVVILSDGKPVSRPVFTAFGRDTGLPSDPRRAHPELLLPREILLTGTPAQKVDIRLTPSPRAASETTAITEYAPGTILLRDVPIIPRDSRVSSSRLRP